MTYDEALAAIHGLEGRPWRSGLDRMRAFVERAGLEPALSNKGYIHVAGTNGKGTTTAFVESILRHQGWRTGAFYSPYVVDYRERIQASGEMIPQAHLVALVERLLPVANGLADTPYGGTTKFELEAAMGFAFWEEKGCDWVALEVGLGGRLDATNVVAPRACVIASIGLDHTAILGHTLEEIAAEKAGIIKPGVPVVVGKMPEEALAVILRLGEERGAPVYPLGGLVFYGETGEGWTVEGPWGRFHGLRPTLGGERTPHNMALAVAACALAGAIRDPSAVAAGVRTAWLPGRFERRTVEGREVVFDGAHNADAARALALGLPKGPLRFVTNMIAGHEVGGFYEAFGERIVGAEVAPIDVPRALPVEETVRRLSDLGIPARGHASVSDALAAALAADDGQVVVTGSNYLVGDALRMLDESP